MASERRRSRDAPFSDLLLSPVRDPIVRFVGLFRTEPGPLPFFEDGEAVPDLDTDPFGQLSGQVVLFSSGANFGRTFASIQRHIQVIRGGRRSSAQIANDIATSERLLDHVWNALTQSFVLAPASSPAFARVRMVLSRTGECQVIVDEDDIFAARDVRQWRLAQQHGIALAGMVQPDWERAAAIVARHSFFFIRDLAHRHYHHDPHSDMASTVYPWSPQDDDAWRRETQYGLVRMAISSRRADNPFRYKEALGVIAYAECFQKNLAGWERTRKGKPVPRRLFFAYDFSSLKQSIEANVRGLDFVDSQRLQVITVILASVLASIAIVIAAGQLFATAAVLGLARKDPGTMPATARAFWSIVEWMTFNPTNVLLGFGTLLLIYFSSFQPLTRSFLIPKTIFNGLFRAVGAVMGNFASTGIRATISWWAIFITAAVSALATMISAFLALTQALRLLSP